MINIAFAGLRHGHVFSIYDQADKSEHFNICGAWEENAGARAWAEDFGVKFNYNSLEELLSDEKVDVVALGGCFGDRGKVAVEALKANKHIVADKPLCTSLEEISEIEALAKANGKKVSCMLTLRFHPKILAVKNLIESGALGEIGNITFGGQHPLQYGRRASWYYEEGKHGGVINDIAIHGVDTLFYALGIRDFRVLSARCWNKYAEEVKTFEDSGQFMLEADNKAGIIADVSYSVPDGIEFKIPFYWQFYVWGTKGALSFALNEKESFYYLKGSAEAIKLENAEVKVSYMEDFYRMLQGEKDVILPMEDALFSTRKTLEIQSFADK